MSERLTDPLKGLRDELGELLKYYELNKKFPPESYAKDWDYKTALHIWVKIDNVESSKRLRR